MKEFFIRLGMQTPKFFRRLMIQAISLAGIATALKTVDASMDSFTLPVKIDTICTYLIVIGTTAATIAKSAVTNPEEVKEKLEVTK